MPDIPTPEQVEAIRERASETWGWRRRDATVMDRDLLLAAYDALTAQNASLVAADADIRAALFVAEHERDEAQAIAAEISDERTRLRGATDYLVRKRDALTAEVEHLREGLAPSELETLADTYTSEGTDLVLRQMATLRHRAEAAERKVAAVRALCDVADGTGWHSVDTARVRAAEEGDV